MKKEVKVCFEVNGIAQSEDGMPCPAGLQITVGEADREFDYMELAQAVDVSKVLKMACLEGYVKPEDVKIITPEEYDQRFGSKEE